MNNEFVLIGNIVDLISRNKAQGVVLEDVVDYLANTNGIPGIISARIWLDGIEYTNQPFQTSKYSDQVELEFPDGNNGFIELFYRESMIFTRDLKKISEVLTAFVSLDRLKKLQYDNNERLKELRSINLTNAILKKNITLEDSLQEICSLLPEAWQYPKYTVARIIFNGHVYKSRGYKETEWCLKQNFETPDNKAGSIEICYLKEFPQDYEGPFLKEERSLLNILSSIISGTYTNQSLQNLLVQNSERLKELRGINNISDLLKRSNSIEESLPSICSILPEAWQYPEDTVVRIKYGDKEFVGPNFHETEWVQRQSFEAPGKKGGTIEVFRLRNHPETGNEPFLDEERDLLSNLASLISGSTNSEVFNKLLSENKERLKELRAINKTSQLIAEGRSVEETLNEIARILVRSWQYPRYTKVKIHFEGKDYAVPDFQETQWSQKENFVTIDNKKGFVQVVYQKSFPKAFEGPFLKEERNLLVNIAKLISGYLNNYKGREIYRKSILKKHEIEKHDEYKKSLITNKRPLQLFFNQRSLDKYIYLDMMKYKVKEILFVATLYDAFILENEDGFFERFMGEIYQYSLFSLPRITGVTNVEEALDMLETKSFDLVILMAGLDKTGPIIFSEKIKRKRPNLPIYLLLNQKSNLKYFEELVASSSTLDELFFWNGDSQIFFSIVKSIEDRANVANDTRAGLVRVILLVEDSSLYYSKYLQILYAIVFGQVQQLLPEVEKNELDKISKMRSRPKILLAKNYEDAMYLFNQYRDYLLCVISDIEYERDGKLDKTAGAKFIKYVQSHILRLPIILQSSDNRNQEMANRLNVFFMNKNSETLLNDLKGYLNYYLGFGDFIFRDRKGNQIAVAKTLKELEQQISIVPDETIYLHAIENQFSIWLMARGEIQLAKTLNPMKVGSLDNANAHRFVILDTIKEFKEEKKRGKVLTYDDNSTMLEEKNIVTIAGGSLGGKGRGLAFINTLIYNLDFSEISNRINIRTPRTVIIGTDEFDAFIINNNLYDEIMGRHTDFALIKQSFLGGNLTNQLEKRLFEFVNNLDRPIAIRSSSLSEDSFTQPFAGVFHTYIIPNSTDRKDVVLEKLKQTIKLVFASVFSKDAKGYFYSIHHKVEDEKMAIVLQELVGERFGDYYYPHISGTACSYNYYPVAHMKPEEGFAMAALGLGTYVVEGMSAFRFSPKYPNIEMYTTKDLINSSQVKFYAVDCRDNDIDYGGAGELASLALLDISEAENNGSIKHCVSVYDQENDRVLPGLPVPGPRILNFANILKYNHIPLAQTLDILLNIIKEALGSPVEIEYAVNLKLQENGLPTFYLLQIKPMIDNRFGIDFDIDQIDMSKMLLSTHNSLGNGEITTIEDVIYVDKEKFNKMKTRNMVEEIEYLNNLMIKNDRPYVLIGPGRWGTRDPYLGIPVNWSQISHAKIIVEMNLNDFPLDSSLGSHFFHNVTSMNIGYFSVNDASGSDFINWNRLYHQEIVHETDYFRHVRFEKPLRILMDGAEKRSVIVEND